MNRLDSRIKWIVLVAGLVTCTKFAGTIAPQAALSAISSINSDAPYVLFSEKALRGFSWT